MTIMDESPALVPLGRTGYLVSPLCFGTIPLSAPRGMPAAAGAALLRLAYELGLNFVDTAELYDNYEPIRLSLLGWTKDVVVATKSYAYDASGMAASLERARQGLDRDRIDLFLLHEMDGMANIVGHRAALDFLLDAKAKGLVGAVGLSTHTVAGVRAACAVPGIDVLHPLINRRGVGLRDGTPAEMAEAIATAAELGIGVYAMKVLAGGHMGTEAGAAVAYVRSLPGVASLAIGMQDEAELRTNMALCRGIEPPAHLTPILAGRDRRLFVEDWCTGCGECVRHCPFDLLCLDSGKVRLKDGADCLLCGYCAAACDKFCLKVV